MLGDNRPNQSDEAGKSNGPSRRDLLKTATGVVAATVVGGALLEASKGTASAAGNNGAAPDTAAFTMKIHGNRQGDFAGDPGQIDNVILGYGFEFDVIAPTAVGTGGGSGTSPQFKPVTITKEWGASTPQIFEALLTNERLQVTLQFDAAEKARAGAFKIELKDATVTDQKLDIAVGDTTRLEQVSFDYRAIDVNGTVGNVGGFK